MFKTKKSKTKKSGVDSRALEPLSHYICKVVEERNTQGVDEIHKLIEDMFRPGVAINVFDGAPVSPLEKAQRIVWDAFAESSTKKRNALAQKALNVSRDCADAYVLLAEGRCAVKDRIALLRKGVEAGKRALGAQLTECGELCWDTDLKARPYLRALDGLAIALLQDGQIDEGVEVSKEILRLDRFDNQSTRINLAITFIIHVRDEELEQLFKQFPMDCSAHMLFTRALFLFKRHGAGPLASRALKEASAANPHVVAIISGGLDSLDFERPHEYEEGSLEEAQNYLLAGFQTYRYVEGATEWFCCFLEDELNARENERTFSGALFDPELSGSVRLTAPFKNGLSQFSFGSSSTMTSKN